MSDQQEPNSRLVNSIEHLIPNVKLEVMGISSMRVMLGFLWCSGFINLVILIFLLVAFSRTQEPLFGTYPSVSESAYFFEGFCRTIGCIGLFFLLLTYPQRILLHAYRKGSYPIWIQSLIVIKTILMSITPSYSLYELVIFWKTFYLRDDKIDLSLTADDFDVEIGVLSLLFTFPLSAIYANAAMTVVFLSYEFIFFAGIYHFLKRSVLQNVDLAARKKEEDEERLEDEEDEEDDETDQTLQDDEDENIPRLYERTKVGQVRIGTVSIFSKFCRCASHALRQYRRGTGYFPLMFQLFVLSYFTVLVGCCAALQINPSVVPIVSFITLVRVCTENITNLIASNRTFHGNISIPGYNFVDIDVNFIVHSPLDLPDRGPCSPFQKNPIVFRRCIAISFFVIFEFILFIWIWNISRNTKMFLRETAYAKARREILSYHFFRKVSIICWGFMIIDGILSSAVNPLDTYVIQSNIVSFDVNSSLFTLNFWVDPLFQVGIGVGTIGFGPFFMMIIVWIAFLAFAYLPADSAECSGWCVGREIKEEGEDDVFAADYLILLAKEDDVVQLLAIKEREEQQEKQKRLEKIDTGDSMLRKRSLGMKQSLRMFRWYRSSSNRQATLPPLRCQLRGNVLVLETEILLFHFMHLSYVLAGQKLDSLTNLKRKLTLIEKESLVENPNYRLVEHVMDPITDTHAMIFVSQDRIIVTFRGSVSFTNWQTDLDSALTPCEYLMNVSPDLSDATLGNQSRAKTMSSLPPNMHRGFVRAYDGVKLRIVELVEQLVRENPSRVVFVTGHSLGGGLAIICVAYLTVTLKLTIDQISLTTWGCPKIGTYSFTSRFKRLCPSAKRFIMANDFITQLPVDVFLQQWTFKGWWHVGTEILLNNEGNMLIRPSQFERFIFQKSIVSAKEHLRMSYATALMIWVIRSHPDYEPDWWSGVINLFHKNAETRLRRLPENLKVRLLQSLLKPGVQYTFRQRMVRDMVVDTTMTDDEDEARVLKTISELLITFRLKKAEQFHDNLIELVELYKADSSMFTDDANRTGRKKKLKGKRTQNEVNSEGNGEEEEEEAFLLAKDSNNVGASSSSMYYSTNC